MFGRLQRTFRKFPITFWVSNIMELFERWAYYGIFAVLALYLTGSADTGALGLTQIQKGILMGSFGAIVYFLPVLTGAIADKFGYKRILLISYFILASGYFLISLTKDYHLLFLIFVYTAIGAALFKPVISATIAKSTTKETSSIGFGIFYMIVNIGAFIGPIVASKSRAIAWDYVFYVSATVILVNVFLLLFFYKEPAKTVSNDSTLKQIARVFTDIYVVLKDLKFLLFLIIIIGFWAMYFQLFYSLPVFIDQWIDTSRIYEILHSIAPLLARSVGTAEGIIAPEMLINLDALYIVIFQVLISAMVMKWKPLNAMISGILVASIGVGLWFITRNGFFLVLSIWIFAIGEMASSPKIIEYLGRIAPKDKVALYMGMSYLPLAGGNFLAGILSGTTYTRIADKFHMAFLDLQGRGISPPQLSETFTQNDLYQFAMNKAGMDAAQYSNYLWHQYQPWKIWMLFTGIGLATTIFLFFYDRLILKKQEK